ncbi:hypothetical protein E3Q23_02490 [Wallemia mellicola]|uniref:Dihydroxyacetone kinase Dak1 n=1 Tax=Wallemia mellicola TaxID=1708541 RepID=A0A4T0TIF8_9BASI|nr:hypothetical protein E3Q23_02490 [Wallemia mellicola]TIB93582.1 dihydroxyacetone kinase Dak1 [Wallemia mellicola]TIC29796.1 dihydroxyacetone kinase Dak1 [Wallemia mellicola]TIC64602.1 dihydroxyacetone kinase Dak1 [Wallemia mellicola]TIC74047.1 dihydroxyacetone kinase Dak1 [Wallemia mellicola]
MSTKHIFNNPNEALSNCLKSSSALNPSLRLDEVHKVVWDTSKPSAHRTVSVVAGGGSGHEPAHVDYVGRGMLQASVSGHIFASPSSSQILQAIEKTPRHHDVLLIVNQYTGDKLNFGLAAQRARSNRNIESIIVGDDVSLTRSAISKVGRRGLTANPLVCKWTGAAAERGLPLLEVKLVGEAIATNTATIGVSAEHCHIPGRPVDGATNPYVELGMGIHNEPGARIVQDDDSGNLITEMLSYILNMEDESRSFVKFDKQDAAILVVNNLGGLSSLELSAVVGQTTDILFDKYGIHPIRTLVGSFMTSLNMPGFSLSLVNLSNIDSMVHSQDVLVDVSLVDLLYDPTSARAWPGVCEAGVEKVVEEAQMEKHDVPRLYRPTNENELFIETLIKRACEAALAVEADLTKWDTIVGDGDCGTTLSAGAQAILDALDSGSVPLDNLPNLFDKLSIIVESSMGGTAGALFALYFAAMCNQIRTKTIGEAVQASLKELENFTPAKVGDRTLIDALAPFCQALSRDGIKIAAKLSQEGAEATTGMTAKLGRAAYCTSNDSTNIPDPGAMGVSAIISGIADCFV